MTTTRDTDRRKEAERLTAGFRRIALFVFLMSGVISILALTGAFYMLQIYDRALASGSVPTLMLISVLAIGLYLFQGLLDVIRSQILVRLGARLDQRGAPLAHRVAIDMPRFGFSASEALERGRDVDTLRGFLGSQGPVALFDLPFMPIFLIFVALLHPMLGALTLGGAVALTALAVLTELMSRRPGTEAHRAMVLRNSIAESNARNAEVIRAMGFSARAVARFDRANAEHLALQTATSDVAGTLGSIARVLRMILQSAVLGLGALLTIRGELTAGAIIAASVASARALAPIDMAIGNWKNMLSAQAAWRRLKETVAAMAGAPEPMPLPAPCRSLRLEGVTVAAPRNGRVLLSDAGFELQAGQALGIVGPSGGGKTTLMRAMAGIWPALRGAVKLDGAALPQWSEAGLGRYLGYLPQEFSLLDTTVGANIARLEEDADPEAVVRAARMAGVHDMIVRLPEGYQTDLGPFGGGLSAGQRQRIGLARALYGEPFVVLLDEPNSNLDAEGEAALKQAILGIKARGGIAVVIAHRPNVLETVDLVAVVQNGRITRFGPRAEVLAPQPALSPVPPRPAAPQPGEVLAPDQPAAQGGDAA